MEAMAIYFGLLTLLMVAVVVRPASALAAVVLLFSLKQWTMAESLWFLAHRVLTNYAVAAIVGVGFIMALLKNRLNLGRYTTAGWATLGLFFLAFISYLWCVNQDDWITQWTLFGPYVLMIVLMLPLVIVKPNDLHDGLMATLFFGVPVLLLLLFTVQFEGRGLRFVGMIYVNGQRGNGGNPLATSQMAGHILLIAVLMRFTGIARFWQFMRWIVVALAIMLIVQSGSRGQLIAAVASAVLLLPFSRHIRNVRGFFAIAVLLAVFGGICFWGYDKFAKGSRWSLDQSITDIENGRIMPSMNVLGYWISHPGAIVFGLGNSSSFDVRVNAFFCEVQPADILGEEGLVGIGLWLIVVISCARALNRLRRNPAVNQNPRIRAMAATMFAMFLFEFILSWKEGSLLADPNVFAFAIIFCRFEWALRQSPQYAGEQLPGSSMLEQDYYYGANGQPGEYECQTLSNSSPFA
ncbi:MAG TPA: hypothetical protein VFC78_21775 [Tepidisphaeraceae bacterium]|nr:hypothetical protein [Tepidisphaeraceae bacterium]